MCWVDYADAASRTKELTAKKRRESHGRDRRLKTHINYAKTRDIYTAYRKAGYSSNIRCARDTPSTRQRRRRLTTGAGAAHRQESASGIFRSARAEEARLCRVKARDEGSGSRFIRLNAEMLQARMPTISGRQEHHRKIAAQAQTNGNRRSIRVVEFSREISDGNLPVRRL